MGDSFVEYQQEEVTKEEEPQEEVSEKDLRTCKEIELDDNNVSEETEKMKIKITSPQPSKRSILKNKGTSIFIVPEDDSDKKQRYLGR